MFCPNISNPKVRSEFNELVTAFGGTPMTEEEFRDSELRNKRQGSEYAAMEAAYRVWDRNNGNAIDSAPNGAPSLLFQDILSRSKDRNDAIYRKTALYTKSFSDKYGEWYNTENKENKITLDVNGEPSIEDANVQKTVGITLKENKEQRVAEALSRFSFDRTLGNDITEMFRNGDNVSSQKVITRLVSQNTLSLGDLRIANILAKHDIPIVIETNKTSDRIAYTVTDSKGNSIVVLNANLMSKVTSQYAAITILHEVSHAVTVNAIDNPSTKEERRFTEMNSKMFHTFRNIAERLHWPLDNVDNGMYAFTNEKEFAACFISDNNVRSLCLEIARKSDTKVSTRIKNFINSIVNLFVNKNIFDTNTSLYNQYTKEMTEYLENKEVVSNNSEEISTALDEYKNRDKRALMEQSFIQFFENNTKLMKIYQQNALVANQYTKSAKQNTINHISDVLQTRIKALRAMSKDSTNKRNENINSLTGIIDALDNVNVDTFTALTLLRNTLAPQLSSDIDNIKKLYNNGYKFSGEEYMHHLHENVNVHADIAKSIEQMLGDEFTVNLIVDEHNKLHKDSPITKEDVETFRQIASAYGARANEGTNVLNKIRDEVVADTLEQVKRETSALDLDDTIRAFRESGNTLGEDLGWFEGIGLGAADASASPLIRASYHLLNDAFNAAEEETNDVMDDYLRSVKGLKLSKLYERAKDGSLTGYLKRRINFGLFYNDYDKFMGDLNEEINAKFNLNLTRDNRLDPTDEEACRYWNARKNEFLEKNAERKYVPEYYKIQSMIPQSTRELIQSYNADIDRILSNPKYTKDGRVLYDLISDEDWTTLNRAWLGKKRLRSFYDENGNRKEEGTLAYNTALALLKQKEAFDKFYETHGGRTLRKKNYDAWNEARNKKIEECGGQEEYEKWKNGKDNKFNFHDFQKWEDRNTVYRLRRVDESDPNSKPIVFQKIENETRGIKPNYGKEYDDIQQQINDLLRPYRDSSGEVDVDGMSIYLKNKVLDLYDKRYKIKKKFANNKLVQAANKAQAEAFAKHITWMDTKYYRKKSEEAWAQVYEMYEDEDGMAVDPDFEYDTYFQLMADCGRLYIDPEFGTVSSITPYSFFQRMIAVNDDDMVYEPGDAWAEQQDNSAFLNDKYTDEFNTTIVPKESLYKDKSFDELMKNAKYKKAYEKTLDVLKRANAKQTNRNYVDNYLLPQIPGTLLNRMSNATGFFGPVKLLFTWLKERFGIMDDGSAGELLGTSTVDMGGNDLDKIYGKHQNQMRGKYPDGRQFNVVPQFYTKRMEDPSIISTDLVSILMSYYQMSAQYEQKSKVRGKLDTILDGIASKSFGDTSEGDTKKTILGKDSRVYKQLDEFLNRNLYNVQFRRYKWKLGRFSIELGRTMGLWKQYATAVNLGLNASVALTGAMSSLFVHTMNALTGTMPGVYKHYNVKNSTQAFLECMGRLGQRTLRTIQPFGRSYTKDKVELLMEDFNISNQFDRKYKYTNRNRLSRFFSANYIYGGLSACDFFVKSQIMVTELMAHRLVDGEFITKGDIYYNRLLWGEDVFKHKLAEFKKAKSLYSVMKVKDGRVTVDDKYKDAYLKSKKLLKNRIEKTAENADGMATPLQRNNLQGSIIGGFIQMHRQFLPLMMQEAWSQTVYDYDSQSYKNGQFRNLFSTAIELSKSSYIPGFFAMSTLGYAFGGPLGGLLAGGTSLVTKKFFGYSSREKKEKNINTKNILKNKFNNKNSNAEYRKSMFNRETLARTLIEIVALNAILHPLVCAICKSYDDDDDWKIQLLLLVLRSMDWESGTKYRLAEISSNFKTATAGTSVTDGATELGQYLGTSLLNTISPRSNMLFGIFDFFKNDSDEEDVGIFDDIMQSGAYEGYPRLLKIISKLTPFHSAWEQYVDPKSKRLYRETQIQHLSEDER